ncbi:hypothetical protein OEZ85_009421 [Tetradesmus obliquus]|uniref:Anaphase-promoting complex subunit 4 WD40 domain-containing protein n=1 Tax=Tetradesmus obliquus TaxID=3088 RepID=A0ABY8UE42_TETOB|nr:hypothetical protein OEZ85_009421 [Tetradesmus obliquus]
MNQQLLIPSGCQQWIRQPTAIGPSNQFAVSSALAIYIHDSYDFRLQRILAQHNQHLNAVCWSPVDSKLLACATSEQVIKVYNVETEAVVYSAQVPLQEPIKKLCWSTHDESVLLAAAGSTVGSWAYKGGGWRVLHSFKSAVTCMQQSATETRVLAVGCADCSLHLYDLLLHKVVCSVSLAEGVVPCDVHFDPLSKQYLLLLCRNGSMALYGISEEQHALSQMFSLAKQPAAERSAAFVPSQPGNFVSISNKTGVLQLWNVSQQQPLKSIKIGNGPAQSVQFFPGTSKALLTFQDGTVMAYDVRSQEQLWSTQPGHTETIFDCCLHPVDPRLLATCSYDGSVRVWDVASGSCLKTLDVPNSAGRESQPVALYSGVAVKKWQLHTQMSLKVAWHPVDAGLLASSSMDGSVVAFKADGTKVKVLRHAGSTSGLAWHPTNTFQLATTSEAGPVYVWDLKLAGDSCLLQTLAGHSKRSFSVAWSPLLSGLLLSGSDDATARVWDVQSGTCVALLLGHVTEVRALCWHPEVPWLVFTGSWDSTIRAWDIRSRACLHVCNHHHGDVYGWLCRLTIHKSQRTAVTKTQVHLRVAKRHTSAAPRHTFGL